ncbi:MAG: hypothetical protein IT289_04895 [Oligoflexia bacterium]|nr:hypothetical protein [Oligoflexia bacterium]
MVMDDLGIPPFDSFAVERWISKQLSLKVPETEIADRLVKLWDDGDLLVSAQESTARFLINGGFWETLARVLNDGLSKGFKLPWGALAEILFGLKSEKPAKKIVDAALAGATRDKALLILSAGAIAKGHQDPRWQKLWDAEISERVAKLRERRNKIFEELRIYQKEGMQAEFKETLQKIMAEFPNDSEAKSLLLKHREVAVESDVATIRRSHDRRKTARSLDEEVVDWPQLRTKLNKIKRSLNLDLAYELSVGLHQMGLHDYADDVLRIHKNKWSSRERAYHLELLVARNLFAEALGESQQILSEPKSAEDAELLYSALYILAKAYLGLRDSEKALGVLKGITTQRPDYRDVSYLIQEIEKGLI